MGSTLFIVSSPFQCLCMLEAISHFKIQDYAVLVTYVDTHSLDKIHVLLNEYKIKYEEKKVAHLVNDFIPLLFSKHRKYDNVFIGDYYTTINENIGRLFARTRYNLYYMDDGTQALSLFSDTPPKRYNSFKIKIISKIYYYGLFWKRCLKKHFFTIYNVSSKEMDIIHNKLSFLKQSTQVCREGVYIIGTNSSDFHLRYRSYLDYLDKLIVYIKERWPSEIVCYCPHRRDTNNKNNMNWCKTNNVECFEPSVSVEYDFVSKGIAPISIIGFTSNALYTLKAIYPSSDVETIEYYLCDERQEKETEIIRQQMAKAGIKRLKLFE